MRASANAIAHLARLGRSSRVTQSKTQGLRRGPVITGLCMHPYSNGLGVVADIGDPRGRVEREMSLERHHELCAGCRLGSAAEILAQRLGQASSSVSWEWAMVHAVDP
jgi:hypothetical protein